MHEAGEGVDPAVGDSNDLAVRICSSRWGLVINGWRMRVKAAAVWLCRAMVAHLCGRLSGTVGPGP